MALLVEDGLAGVGSVSVASAAPVRVYRFTASTARDPIAKGRLLSHLEGAEGVVVVGREAASWAARDVDGVPLYFAGGVARVPGAALARRRWSGSFAAPLSPVLDYAERAGWRRLGVLCTPGFESALAPLREAARARNVRVLARSVASAGALPAELGGVLEGLDVLWLLGDPLLSSGAGLQFMVEQSLARRLPLVVQDPALLDEGGYLAVEPDWPAVLQRAAALAADVARGRQPWPSDGVTFGGGRGRVLVNEVLRRKWGLAAPGGRP